MIDLDITIFIQLVNFLIMWFVLDLILFRPIRGIIRKRNEHMEQQMDTVEKFSGQATEKLKNYEAALAEARTAGAQERDRLKEEGLGKEQELVGAAQKDASAKVQASRQEISAEADKAKETLKADVRKLAEAATAKILG
ncbi:ATP synthase F0 subunit B [Desulfohalovibrio reitneri]|uniref:ATP synthase F0 subunit B n=1 Tax=Desulfohalovibrio reitneri TaxID=1307759 RepID=UPI0004A6FD3D|nr:ATP synthase F0 subunit B [Desulfohalovibrio reitneri]